MSVDPDFDYLELFPGSFLDLSDDAAGKVESAEIIVIVDRSSGGLEYQGTIRLKLKGSAEVDLFGLVATDFVHLLNALKEYGQTTIERKCANK